MADTQAKEDEKRRAKFALSILRSEVGSVVDILNRDILCGYDDPYGACTNQKARYVSELNNEIIRSGLLCSDRTMSGAKNLKRFEELLRNMRHYSEVLEQKD